MARATAASSRPWRGIWSSGLPRTSMIALRVCEATSQPLVSAAASSSLISPASAAARRCAASVDGVRRSGSLVARAAAAAAARSTRRRPSPPRPSLVCVVGSAPRGSRSVSTRALIRRISTTSRMDEPALRVAELVGGRDELSAELLVAGHRPRPQQRLPLPGRCEPGPVAAVRVQRCGPAGRSCPPAAGSRRSPAAGPGVGRPSSRAIRSATAVRVGPRRSGRPPPAAAR